MTDLVGTDLLARAPRVQALLERTAAAGLSLEGVWLVGGAVRDAIIGRPAGPDLDLAVEGAGIAFAHLLASATGGEVIAENAPFGTATVAAELGEAAGLVRIDVATCRTERYAEPGALPTVRPGASIADDLARRDVAINAIAIALFPDAQGVHAILDPHDGIGDLGERRLMRVLHDGSFADDPTRIFRVARYAGRLNFRVDEHTRSLAVDAVRTGALGTVSSERVRAELELVLREPAWDALTLLASWGVVERLDPRLEGAFRAPLLLRSLDEACGDDPDLNQRAWTLRLAALARPLGSDAAGWMGWLGFPGEVVGAVVDHIRVLEAAIDRGAQLRELPNSGLYVELGEVVDDSIALAALALDDDPELLARLVAFGDALRDTRLTVRGDDVMAAGVPAGPLVGRILGVLFLRSLDGELRGEADERAALAELVAEAQTLVTEESDAT
ncbi:MAG: Polynucleotide adenylyltransferase region [Thermoleophilia bacterium]|nr:Polynucleotide adenylyltransferase region [Thermoleophilia bacterium]